MAAFGQSPASSGTALLPALFPQWQNTHVADLSDADLYGPALSLPGSTAADKARQFLTGPLSRLGLRPQEWQPVRTTTTRRFTYVSYVRQVEGRKVRFDHLHFQFAPDGTLVRLRIAAADAPERFRQPF